jgi:predicted metalloendopeptidase
MDYADIGKSEASAKADSMVLLESRLAGLLPSLEETRDGRAHMQRMTLNEASINFPNIPWSLIFEHLKFPDGPKKLFLQHPEYFVGLNQIFADGNNFEIIKLCLVSSVIQNVAEFVSIDFQPFSTHYTPKNRWSSKKPMSSSLLVLKKQQFVTKIIKNVMGINLLVYICR